MKSLSLILGLLGSGLAMVMPEANVAFADASQIECVNKQFPENMGSMLRLQVLEQGLFGNAQLFYNDGETDLLKKTWAIYNVSKLTVNHAKQGVYYLSWGGGSSTDPSKNNHVPKYMAVHASNGKTVSIGVFSQQKSGNLTRNVETIYQYTCKKIEN